MATLSQYFASIGLKPGITPAAPDKCQMCGGNGTIYVDNGDDDYGLRPCPSCRADFCETCDDHGWIVLKNSRSGFRKVVPCPSQCRASKEFLADRYHRMYGAARLPVEYAHLTFESFDRLPDQVRDGKLEARVAVGYFAEHAASQCYVDYAEIGAFFGYELPSDSRNWIVLYGPHGRGKTGIMAAAANALLAGGFPVLYTRLQDLLKFAVQGRYGNSTPDDDYGDMSAMEVLDNVRRAPILLLDEFDMPDAMSADKQSAVESIIRYRYGEGLPMIITTNLDIQGIEKRWGVTTTSVIRARAHVIQVNGVNLRPDVLDYRLS